MPSNRNFRFFATFTNTISFTAFFAIAGLLIIALRTTTIEIRDYHSGPLDEGPGGYDIESLLALYGTILIVTVAALVAGHIFKTIIKRKGFHYWTVFLPYIIFSGWVALESLHTLVLFIIRLFHHSLWTDELVPLGMIIILIIIAIIYINQWAKLIHKIGNLVPTGSSIQGVFQRILAFRPSIKQLFVIVVVSIAFVFLAEHLTTKVTGITNLHYEYSENNWSLIAWHAGLGIFYSLIFGLLKRTIPETARKWQVFLSALLVGSLFMIILSFVETAGNIGFVYPSLEAFIAVLLIFALSAVIAMYLVSNNFQNKNTLTGVFVKEN